MQATPQRTAKIDHLRQHTFDLVVIGGGITGAGVALDAASRGLDVALIERDDFASGTSSKSTKLIHGGLRYLKNLEIGLVREVGQERAVVHDLAPHLVRPEKMLLPLVEGGSLGKFSTSMALWVYDFLADVEGDDKRVMLSKEETSAHEPLLRTDILTGGGFYAEYRTDDARLTIENIKTAEKEGATALNYVEAKDFTYDAQGKISGVICHDHFSGGELTIKTRHVISSTGPWVDDLRKKDKSMTNRGVFLSKGVHIVVSRERLPLQHAVYFDVPDGRMLFAIPRLRCTYIGTTDTPYSGDPKAIPINREDVDYLLKATNEMFPTVQLTVDDVESSWAGVRPLIFEEGKSAGEMSRKDEIFESASGLLSIAGGKLTGYRKMAERVVDRLGKQLRTAGEELRKTHTKDLVLTGGPFEDFAAVKAYEKHIENYLLAASLTPDRAAYLVSNYGKQSPAIIDAATQRQEGTDVARLAAAEAAWCIEHELALYPIDWIERRSGRLYFDMPSIEPVLEEVLDVFAAAYQYSAAEREREKKRVLEAMAWVSVFEVNE
ncbi:glycerol-3-phosphate dehydrogenase/oxidase [Neolewinella lacunae]|uniref:Glycerol-3-phosphate dehydrogenase n=1 Tax=Neolewinella lacunae TaxID=1517758 RepID=A0A923PI68_9BACT|nr:glycerol-3-phosphate dehydrogenase/oxidase [Neolewinella lacunae]MBC6994532.1 glycerol-3-phosphate dehydrogenase/oxidase [Neolewinella lacunae]MDN3634225.1 glycerol-3-phosphate dehydrogenase/oxidase [Neolewinella lacunae]